MKIEGATAIVTGGGQGIGKAMVVALLEEGANVVIADIDEEKGKQTQEDLNSKYGNDRVLFSRCDVADNENLRLLFKTTQKHFGSVTIVCNNAGIGEGPNFLDEDTLDPSWGKVIDVNVNAVCNGTRIAILAMRKQGTGGVIVNTASMAGLFPYRPSPVYCATKHAVIGFSRSLRYLGKEGIRVNAICPDMTKTDLLARDIARSTGVEGMANQAGILQPEFIAQGMIHLVKNDDIAGEVMRCTQKLGIDFQRYGKRHRPPVRGPPANLSRL